MRWAVIAVLMGVMVPGCGGRPASEVSTRAKGWVSRLQRNVEARDQAEAAKTCEQIRGSRVSLTESELSQFDQVCAYCKDGKWEEAESRLRVMAGEGQ